MGGRSKVAKVVFHILAKRCVLIAAVKKAPSEIIVSCVKNYVVERKC